MVSFEGTLRELKGQVDRLPVRVFSSPDTKSSLVVKVNGLRIICGRTWLPMLKTCYVFFVASQGYSKKDFNSLKKALVQISRRPFLEN